MNFKLWLENEYLDNMGVLVRDTSIAKGIDAGIADCIEKINKAGFKTCQSMSGLKRDYPSGKRYSGDGYIGFYKDDLKPGQGEQIRAAAKSAKLPIFDSAIFFAPALVVRVGITKNDESARDLLKKAGAMALQAMNLPPDKINPERPSVAHPGEMSSSSPKDDKDFMQWLKLRDQIDKELLEKSGGWIDEEEKVRRWQVFCDYLIGKQ